MVELEGFGTLITDELKILLVTFLLQLLALFSRQPHKSGGPVEMTPHTGAAATLKIGCQYQ